MLPLCTNRFAQQKLIGWRPIFTARSAELFYLIVGSICLALGIAIVIASQNTVYYKVEYGMAAPEFQGKTHAEAEQILRAVSEDTGIVYNVTIDIDQTMNPPIYLNYRLSLFFQNFRRYVRSYDPTLMWSGDPGPGVGACLPYTYENTVGANASQPYDGAVNPCGQIAHSLFNDTFSAALLVPSSNINDREGEVINLALDDSNIAWESDANYLYGNFPAQNYNNISEYRGGGTTGDIPLDEAQNWMVWMRPSGQATLSKPYGTINQKLEKGTKLVVTVTNRYNTYGFSGDKYIILTTNSWVGGKNEVMGWVYVGAACMCYALALYLMLGWDVGLVRKRGFGDENEMTWVKGDVTKQGAVPPQIKHEKKKKNGGAKGTIATTTNEEEEVGIGLPKA